MLPDSTVPAAEPSGRTVRPPFGGRRRLASMVQVRFASSFTTFPFDAGDLVVRVGDAVVADTPRGPVIGKVATLAQRKVVAVADVRRIVRVATANDLERWKACERDGAEALKTCVRALRKVPLDIKLVHVEVPLDRSRALVYYSSEERVEFRNYIRVLSSDLPMRVELRPIGVREGTGVIGGIGPCGGSLCCSTFLDRFSSISIKFAKDQGLSLNPQKITGMCGRLKCCLVYEQPVYREVKAYAPRARTGVLTPSGPGNIREVDVLNRTLRVALHSGSEGFFHIRDVVLLGRELRAEEIQAAVSREDEIRTKRRQKRGLGAESQNAMTPDKAAAFREEYLWDGVGADPAAAGVKDGEAAPPAAPRRDERRRPDDRRPDSRRDERRGPTDRQRSDRPAGERQAGGPQRPAPGQGAPRPRPQQPAAGPAENIDPNAVTAAGGAPGGEVAKKKRRRKKKKNPGVGGEPGAAVLRETQVGPEGQTRPAAPRVIGADRDDDEGGDDGDDGDDVADSAGGVSADGQLGERRKRRRRRRRRGGGGGEGGAPSSGGEGGQGGGEGGG